MLFSRTGLWMSAERRFVLALLVCKTGATAGHVVWACRDGARGTQRDRDRDRGTERDRQGGRERRHSFWRQKHPPPIQAAVLDP